MYTNQLWKRLLYHADSRALTEEDKFVQSLDCGTAKLLENTLYVIVLRIYVNI